MEEECTLRNTQADEEDQADEGIKVEEFIWNLLPLDKSGGSNANPHHDTIPENLQPPPVTDGSKDPGMAYLTQLFDKYCYN